MKRIFKFILVCSLAYVAWPHLEALLPQETQKRIRRTVYGSF